MMRLLLRGGEVEPMQPHRARDDAGFARRLSEIFAWHHAPDVVSQGTGSVQELARELKQMGGVYLWWD